MWRKSEHTKEKSPVDDSALPVFFPQSTKNAAHPNLNLPAAVPSGISIAGEVSGSGDLVLDGDFEGKIRLTGGTFTVGRQARVNAEIEARQVLIRGEVTGVLKACERVHISSTGKLTGDVETRGIVIEEGAVLHTNITVPEVQAASASQPAAIECNPSESTLGTPQLAPQASSAKAATAGHS